MGYIAGAQTAVYHGTYWGTVNGEDKSGYIIEVENDRVALYEIDEHEYNTLMGKREQSNIPKAITELIEVAECSLQPGTDHEDGGSR